MATIKHKMASKPGKWRGEKTRYQLCNPDIHFHNDEIKFGNFSHRYIQWRIVARWNWDDVTCKKCLSMRVIKDEI